MVARLAQPACLKRLGVVIVVGLYLGAPIGKLAAGPADFARITALDLTALNRLFEDILRVVIRSDAATIEVVVWPIPKTRSHGDSPTEYVPHGLARDTRHVGYLLEA